MTQDDTSVAFQTPALRRRLACFVYEGVLLFGVVTITGLAWSVLTDQRHALSGQFGLQVTVFIVLGLYFVGFWSTRGQTLPMQTWHIRLLTRNGQPVSRLRAVARYLAAWLWFMPALLGLWLAGLRSSGVAMGVIFGGMLAWAALSRLHPQRQFWHDALCGTRLVVWRPTPKPGSAGRAADAAQP
jgi:uncharacterized RDD family membrane protein YckC